MRTDEKCNSSHSSQHRYFAFRQNQTFLKDLNVKNINTISIYFDETKKRALNSQTVGAKVEP